MMQRKKVDLKRVLASLNTTCPLCGYSITPAEIVRIDFERIEVSEVWGDFRCEQSPKSDLDFSQQNLVPVFYCDRVEGDGDALFQLACANDLEGIVAKRKYDPYLPDQASWLKIRNTNYTRWEGREELFERERESDPDLSLWDDCVRACADTLAWDS
jgi:hypothetical protein